MIQKEHSDETREEAMKPRMISGIQRLVLWSFSLCAAALVFSQTPAAAQGQYTVKPVAEKKIKQLPEGPLYCRVENFPTVAQAQAAGEQMFGTPTL
jgi:hypothetical protein